MRKSPKDTQCPHCQRFFTKKGCREHQRHVRCSPSSTAKKRVFERARCKAEQRSASPSAGRVERKRDDAQQQTDASTAFRTPADAERTRRIWEEALLRQQLQKDKTGGRKHHAQSQDI